MGFGLFGKVPQKRDFVSIGLPHAVLNPFESWLQSAVAASRNALGRDWQELYLVAPIWRFWIGPDVFGQTCMGALMPSVDKVGRYFPLAILYCVDAGEALAPPLIAPRDDWYESIESRLLAVLAQDDDAYLASLLSGLAAPAEIAAPASEPVGAAAPPAPAEPGDIAAAEGEPGAPTKDPVGAVVAVEPPYVAPQARIVSEDAGGALISTLAPGASLHAGLLDLRLRDYDHAARGRSYWWCALPAMDGVEIFAGQGLPDPFLYARMLGWRGSREADPAAAGRLIADR